MNKTLLMSVWALWTYCKKKETRDTLTTKRSNRLNQFLQKEPWWRNAPCTVICREIT